ncbi:hypothetical protein [Desulfosarcina ovata]
MTFSEKGKISFGVFPFGFNESYCTKIS